MLQVIIVYDKQLDYLLEIPHGSIDEAYISSKQLIDELDKEVYEVAVIININRGTEEIESFDVLSENLRPYHRFYAHLSKVDGDYNIDVHNSLLDAENAIAQLAEDNATGFNSYEKIFSRSGYITTVCFNPEKQIPAYLQDMFPTEGGFVMKDGDYHIQIDA